MPHKRTKDKQAAMQTTHSFDKRPNALSGFNAPKNKEGLVAVAIPTPHKHSLSCTTCKNKPTNRLQRPRKPNNSRMRQPINSKYHQLINSKTSTHKLTNSKTSIHELKNINPQTQKIINPKTQKLINSKTKKLINPKNHKLINPKTYQPINPKNHKLTNPQTQKLKNLNYYFYFTTTLYFSCHSSENLG